MGGWGSGRQGGRPIADHSYRIDLAWMLRTGKAREGDIISSSLHWSRGDEPSGSIRYRAFMDIQGYERLELDYTNTRWGEREEVHQVVHLCHTQPHFGGKRWWMICPFKGVRVGKLYLPPGGDRFASRQAWRLGYHSQRLAARDRPFEALFRIQKKLGCTEGWEMPIRRPKGMWHSTYAKLEERYWELDHLCAFEMAVVMGRLVGLKPPE